MRVRIFGPNLGHELESKGSFHVHAAGCGDCRKYRGCDGGEVIDIETPEDAVDYIYDPGSFEYDPDSLEDRRPYDDDFYFAPCARNLPNREGLHA